MAIRLLRGILHGIGEEINNERRRCCAYACTTIIAFYSGNRSQSVRVVVNIGSDLMKHRCSIKGRLAFNRQRNAFAPCVSTFPPPSLFFLFPFLPSSAAVFVCLVFETGNSFLFQCLFCDSSRAEVRFVRKFATIVSIENEFSSVRLKHASYLEFRNFRVQRLPFVAAIYFARNINISNCNRLFFENEIYNDIRTSRKSVRESLK